MATVEELVIRIQAEGVSSLGGLDDKIKELNKTIKQLPLSQKEAIDAAMRQRTGLMELRNEMNAVHQTAQTKLMKTYFALGTVTRSAQAATMGLTRVIQDLPFGMRGILANIVPLTEQFRRMKEEGTSLRSILGSLAGPAGIGLAVAGLTSLIYILPKAIEFFKETSDAVRKTYLEIAELEYQLGIITKSQYLNQLRDQFDQLGEQILKMRALNVIAAVEPMYMGLLTKIAIKLGIIKADEQAIADKTKEQLSTKVKINEEEKKGIDLTKEKLRATEDLELANARALGLEKSETTALLRRTVGKPQEFPTWGAELIPGPVVQLPEIMQEAKKESVSFTQQMAAGFANSTNVLAQGFVRAFGLGQSLLDQFLASFLGSLAQTGLNFLTGGLFGLLGIKFQHGGIIPEPVLGIGRSGRAYSFGEAGPEYVTPTSSNAIAFGSLQKQMGAMTEAITSREWELRGTNLVLAYDRANKVLRERRM